MPRVPLSDGPQLQVAPAQGGYLPTPDVSSGTRALAQGLGAVAEVADRKATRDAETAAFNANAAITAEWLQFDADARTKYRGTNVDQYEPAAAKFWQDAAERHAKNLDPMAQQLASKALVQKRTEALASGLRFVEGEKERNFDSSAQAAKAMEIQLGVTTGDVESARERVRGVNAAQAARKGWTPEMLAAENTRDLSTLHFAHIAKLAETDAGAAKSYYEANRAEVDATRQASIEKVLKAETDNQFAEQFAAKVAAKPLEEQLAAAGDIKDPHQREKALTRIKQNATLVKEAQAERERKFSDQAWQMVGKGQRVPEALLSQMDGRERVQLQEFLRQRAEHNMAAKAIKTDPAVHAQLWEMMVRDPEGFKKERLQAYGMKLSGEDLEQLYTKQRELLNPKNEKEVLTFQNRMTARLEQLGINTGQGDEKKRGAFRAAAQSEIDAYTARYGKQPDAKAETEILDRLMIESDSWFGPSRYFEATPDQRGTFVPKITDADRAAITAGFKQRGVAKPSEEQILRAFKAMKGL